MRIPRSSTALVVGLLTASLAHGQNTTLTINGVTAADNTGAVSVKIGSTMTVTIHGNNASSRPYGLFGAIDHNTNNPGWYLKKFTATSKKPFPVVTGVATTAVEAAFPPLDISPDRGSNPRIHLDANGNVTLTFRVPSTTVANSVVYYQAVSLPVGSNAPDYSNAITVTYVAPTKAATMLVSVSNNSTVDPNHVGLGTLTFNNNDPTSATYTAEPSGKLLNLQIDNATLSDTNQWASRANSSSSLRKARSITFQSLNDGPAVNQDNYEYARVILPPTAGVDGIFGTADDVPARGLLRCLDNVSPNEAFFVLVNRGNNPNQPGTSFYGFDKLRKANSASPATNDSYKQSVAVSPDGTRAAAIFADTNGSANIISLFATDGSKPFLDSNNAATDVVNVTPGSTALLYSRAFIFTNNRLWFASGAGSPNVQTLWTVDARAQKPTPSQVTIPLNSNYSSPAINNIPDKCMLVPRGGGTRMCFLAGKTLTLGANPSPDFIQTGDWYCVTEAVPTSAVNVTKFPVYGTTNIAPKLLVPGDASGGTTFNGPYGFGSMSPDGTKLAFVALTQAENGSSAGDDDEVYVATTNDLNNDGVGDDAGSTLFTSQITNNSRFASGTGGNTSLDNSAFLNMVDSDNLLFFYGTAGTTTPTLNVAQMDLFNWRISTSTLTCLNRSPTFPISTPGTIVPEGGFFSPNGRYYYFARGFTDANTTTKTNLVCVDTQQLKLINITGAEFSGATAADTVNNTTVCENLNWHLSFAGGNFPSLCYFAAPVFGGAAPNTMQVWTFDANFPSAALQLTSDTSFNSGTQDVESLTGSPYSLGCAWFWTRNGSRAQSEAEYQDLTFFFRDVLTQGSSSSNAFGWSTTLSAIDWIPAATSTNTTGAAPPALVMCIGDTSGAGAFVDQASDGEFYYFSLDGTMDYLFNNASEKHEVGTTALSGGKFKGYLNVYYAAVQ